MAARADSAKTISLHHHIVGGDFKIYTVESRYNANRYTAISVITWSAHGPVFSG